MMWLHCAIICLITVRVEMQMNNFNFHTGGLIPLFERPSATTGSFVVTVNAPLEHTPYSQTAVLRFGSTNCQETFWLSTTTLLCKSPAKFFDSTSNISMAVSVVLAQTYNPDPKFFKQNYVNCRKICMNCFASNKCC